MSSITPPDRMPWVAIPMKSFALAKGRLAGALDDRRRRAFAEAMLEDVLAAATAAEGIGGVLAISPDPAVRALVDLFGASAIADEPPSGLDGAVRAAARWLASREAPMIVVPGDVPLLRAADIERIAAAVACRTTPAMAIAPSRDGTGTNALALSPPDTIAPEYGDASFQRHVERARAAGAAPTILAIDTLALDIDDADDLALFAGLPSATRAWRFLDAQDLVERLRPSRRAAHG